MAYPENRLLKLLCCGVFLSLTGCTQFDVFNALNPYWADSRIADISYGSLPRQKLDVYVPHHSNPAAGVVIFFYGGDWQAGEKFDYRFVAHGLTSEGFIAVMPDYRLYPQVTFPAFIQDGAMAVRWVHDHISQFGGDPNRVYLMGHSAGAYVAVMLTLDEGYLKAVKLSRQAIRATAALAGPYDFVPSSEDLPVFRMKVGDTDPDPRMEPVTFVDGHEPPMLLVQGEKDKTVAPENAVHLAGRILKRDGQVQLVLYPDQDHRGVVMALGPAFHWLGPVLRDITDFFRRH